MITRRSLLRAAPALLFAPAIVRAASLMPVSIAASIPEPYVSSWLGFNTITARAGLHFTDPQGNPWWEISSQAMTRERVVDLAYSIDEARASVRARALGDMRACIRKRMRQGYTPHRYDIATIALPVWPRQ